MATTIIDKDGNLTVEVIEYDHRSQDGHGNPLVAQKQQFRVRMEVLIEHSMILAAMLRSSLCTKAQKDFITLDDDSVASMDIWFRVLHKHDPNYDVPLQEMWLLVATCDKYKSDLNMLKPWFAGWYQEHNIEQYYANWNESRYNTVPLTPRSLLYPCWIFDHAIGFMRATRFLCYRSTGHITEFNPTNHDKLRLESRVIREFHSDSSLPFSTDPGY